MYVNLPSCKLHVILIRF